MTKAAAMSKPATLEAAIADSIRRAYEGRTTQTVLAEEIGTTQATISRWVRGDGLPALGDLPLIEKACGRPLGFIMRGAGLIDDVVTVEEAIDADPHLPEPLRDPLKAAYRAMLPRR